MNEAEVIARDFILELNKTDVAKIIKDSSKTKLVETDCYIAITNDFWDSDFDKFDLLEFKKMKEKFLAVLEQFAETLGTPEYNNIEKIKTPENYDDDQGELKIYFNHATLFTCYWKTENYYIYLICDKEDRELPYILRVNNIEIK